MRRSSPSGLGLKRVIPGLAKREPDPKGRAEGVETHDWVKRLSLIVGSGLSLRLPRNDKEGSMLRVLQRVRNRATGTLRCSFCGRSEREVTNLIAGAHAYICDACIDACSAIIAAERRRS